MVQGSVCTKIWVCIVFRCGQKAPYRQTESQAHIYTSELKKTHSRGFLQGNRGDMRKIHMTWQFFRLAALTVIFSKTQKKNGFQIRSIGVGVPNFRSVQFFVWPGCVIKEINTQTNTQIHTYTSEIRNILDGLLASQGF